MNKGVNLKTTELFKIVLFGLVVVGCSRPPEPVKLDGGSATTINQGLVAETQKGVGKDPFLKNNKWSYNMYFAKTNKGLIENDQTIKAFFLAHNSAKMVIIGNEAIAQEYKDYFLNNQVTADIEIHPVDSIDLSKNKVNVLFFSKNYSKGK